MSVINHVLVESRSEFSSSSTREALSRMHSHKFLSRVHCAISLDKNGLAMNRSGRSHFGYATRSTVNRSRNCFSISTIANTVTPTPTINMPSNNGIASVPKTACNGGK